jgi:hypothetical protein
MPSWAHALPVRRDREELPGGYDIRHPASPVRNPAQSKLSSATHNNITTVKDRQRLKDANDMPRTLAGITLHDQAGCPVQLNHRGILIRE